MEGNMKKKMCVCAQLLSRLWFFAPLSMGLSQQEYWNGLPYAPPGDLPGPGTESVSPALAGGFFTLEPPGKLYL